MSYAPTPAAAGNGHRVALLGIGLLGAALFALVQAGVVAPPDLEGALTDLSDTLGPWTYALVGGLAFLETGAFVGLIAPGETAVVLGGVVAAVGGVDLPLMLLITWSAAALGDLASFALGRRLGRRFLIEHGPRIGVTAPRLERVETFFGRHDTAEHDRGLARSDQADERAGLEEGECGDERVGPGAERVREVGERAFEVGRRDDAGLHEREQRGAHKPDAEERDAVAVARGGGCGRVAHAGLRAGSGDQRGAVGLGANSGWPASSAPQRATVRRRLPSAARPTGAGSQIASAR